MRVALERYISGLYHDIPDYVFICLLIVLIIGSAWILINSGYKKGKNKVLALLLGLYVFLIYCSTVIFRPYLENAGHNYTPFWTYDEIEGGIKGLIPVVIMNVLVFVPLGLLLSCFFRYLKWWGLILLIGGGVSVSVEILQFLFSRGSAEFDDVFHNTIGCLLGFMLYAIIKGIWKFFSYLFWPRWGRNKVKNCNEDN